MFLHTPLYLVFLAAVCLLYWLLPRPGWRKAFLLLAGCVMYAAFDVRFLLVLLAVSAATYWLGRAAAGGGHPGWCTALSVALNLGALAYFKYANFFLAGTEQLLIRIGVTPPASLPILLPIGISFYTFQAIAYSVEIKRGKIRPVENFVDFGLYLAFFPKLIAGPIVRPVEFLPRLADPPRGLSRSEAASALRLLVTGLFKKVVIADGIAVLADISFRAAAMPQGSGFPAPLYIAGFYLYAVLIYADFSGYTDIARGSAGLLGLPLPENFHRPYFSLSPGEFWNRWHMTLTQWFREYVFYPLSRRWMIASHRRHPRLVQIAATMITMTLVGLWHGAAWTFVLWGAWHGLLVSLDRLLGFTPLRWWQKLLAGTATFHLVGLGWILFRAASLEEAGRFLAGLFSFHQTVWFSIFLLPALLAVLLVWVMDAAQAAPPRLEGWIRTLRPAGYAAAVVLIAGIWLLRAVSQTGAPPFIYGSF